MKHYRVTSINNNGTKYSKNDVLIISMDDDEPVFGLVRYFIITGVKQILIVMTLLETNQYKTHLHSYEVKKTSCTFATLNDLIDYHPLALLKSFQASLATVYFVNLKYHVFKY